MRAEDWRRRHMATCKEQRGSTIMVGGRQVTLCAGFEENFFGSLGEHGGRGVVVCRGCGARREVDGLAAFREGDAVEVRLPGRAAWTAARYVRQWTPGVVGGKHYVLIGDEASPVMVRDDELRERLDAEAAP